MYTEIQTHSSTLSSTGLLPGPFLRYMHKKAAGRDGHKLNLRCSLVALLNVKFMYTPMERKLIS